MVTMVTEGLYSTPLLSYLGVHCGNNGNYGNYGYHSDRVSYLGVHCGNYGNRGAVQHTFTVVSRGTLW